MWIRWIRNRFRNTAEKFSQELATLPAQGVEGVFRASCERSLAVLRANKEALLTVLEVMLHDPLYNWSVGPGKAAAKQAGEWKKLCDEDGGQKNKGNRQVALIHLKGFFFISTSISAVLYIHPTFFFTCFVTLKLPNSLLITYIFPYEC
jgi:hypothetical protein